MGDFGTRGDRDSRWRQHTFEPSPEVFGSLALNEWSFAMKRFDGLFQIAAQLDWVGITVTRIGLIVVLVWIGSLKVYTYEADGIVPFVANSPFLSFFYKQPPGEYRQYKNREGEVVPDNREWHERNGTYPFAYGL